jgi:hypothetical protein
MKNDENNQGTPERISAEMEARIVAWVSGDASPAEAAELALLASANPAVAAFKARMDAVRSLASEGISADKTPLRMSESRRAALLRELGSAAKEAATATSTVTGPSLVTIQRRQQRERRWMLAVAACVTVGLFLSMMVPSYQKVRSIAMEREAKESVPKAMMGEFKSRDAQKREAASVNFEVPPDDREVVLAAPEAESAPQFNGSARYAPAPASKGVTILPVELPTVSGGRLAQAKVGSGNQIANTVAEVTPETEAAEFKKEVIMPKENEGPSVAVSDKAEVETQAPIVLSPFAVRDAEDKGSYRAAHSPGPASAPT